MHYVYTDGDIYGGAVNWDSCGALRFTIIITMWLVYYQKVICMAYGAFNIAIPAEINSPYAIYNRAWSVDSDGDVGGNVIDYVDDDSCGNILYSK